MAPSKVKTGLLVLGLGALSNCAEDPVLHAPAPENPLVFSARPPPPISGGTLLVTRDGRFAVAADPDRDRLWIASIPERKLLREIALDAGEEPGRVVEGPSGVVYVVLRRGGGFATLDVEAGIVLGRTPVCGAPRGLAFDGNDTLYVACSGGELVTRSVATDAEMDRVFLGEDLRDVVLDGASLWVTHFRSASLRRLPLDGGFESQFPLTTDPMGELRPGVAYRAVAAPGGGVVVIHQRGFGGVVATTPDAYSVQTGCTNGLVESGATFVDASGSTWGATVASFALPVDLAVSADGSRLSLVSAGNGAVVDTTLTALEPAFSGSCGLQTPRAVAFGQPVAVAFAGNERILQSREPAGLLFEDGESLSFPGESMLDTGHELFHRAVDVNVGLACASCHPEGREDGLSWTFVDVGQRRTQSVAGGVLATAPLHWDGDLPTFDRLMNEVFTRRMSGPAVGAGHAYALSRWVDSIPAVPSGAPLDAAAVARGKDVFERPAVACTGCHSGELLTNNQSFDVGTGGVFQTPSLRGLWARAPYMHQGCAPTLEARLLDASCGGGDAHGRTSQLSSDEVADLVQYLKSL